METFRYKVVLTVEVPAFNESDAWDTLQDTFGVGEELGILVTECEFDDFGTKVKK